jgi:hypothetical protein
LCRRFSEAADVHSDNPHSRLLQDGLQAAILGSQVAHPGNAENDRTCASRVVECHGPALMLHELRGQVASGHTALSQYQIDKPCGSAVGLLHVDRCPGGLLFSGRRDRFARAAMPI